MVPRESPEPRPARRGWRSPATWLLCTFARPRPCAAHRASHRSALRPSVTESTLPSRPFRPAGRQPILRNSGRAVKGPLAPRHAGRTRHGRGGIVACDGRRPGRGPGLRRPDRRQIARGARTVPGSSTSPASRRAAADAAAGPARPPDAPDAGGELRTVIAADRIVADPSVRAPPLPRAGTSSGSTSRRTIWWSACEPPDARTSGSTVTSGRSSPTTWRRITPYYLAGTRVDASGSTLGDDRGDPAPARRADPARHARPPCRASTAGCIELGDGILSRSLESRPGAPGRPSLRRRSPRRAAATGPTMAIDGRPRRRRGVPVEVEELPGRRAVEAAGAAGAAVPQARRAPARARRPADRRGRRRAARGRDVRGRGLASRRAVGRRSR